MLIELRLGPAVSDRIGGLVYWFGHPNSGARKTRFKFSFSVAFMQKTLQNYL